MKKSIIMASMALIGIWAFNACKKNPSDVNNKELEERSIAALKARILQEGIPIRIASNVKSESFLSDREGNKLTDLRTLTACQDEYGDDIISFDECVMEECDAYYDCGASGFKIKATWKIVTQLPLMATSFSRGKIRIKNTSGTILYTNSNITPVTITVLPQTDPNFPNSTVYQVVYESGVIDQNHWLNNGGEVENALQTDTDCGYIVPVQYTATNTVYWNAINTDACLRIDKVFVNPPTYSSNGSVNTLGSYAGVNLFGDCFTGAIIMPEYQHVKFSNLATGTSYIDLDITPYTLTIIPDGTIPKGTNVKVEYYNKSYAGCTPPYMTRTEIYNNW